MLYTHKEYFHLPRNANDRHLIGTLNQRIALTLTAMVGSMPCAYLFLLLALAGFPYGAIAPSTYVQWLSQTLIQLVMLSVIMVGQNSISKKQSSQADEQFKTTCKIYHDIEQVMKHLDALDRELVQQSKTLEFLITGMEKES